jgi:hypothetical protein
VQSTSLAPMPEQAWSVPRAQGGPYRTVTSLELHSIFDQISLPARRPTALGVRERVRDFCRRKWGPVFWRFRGFVAA